MADLSTFPARVTRAVAMELLAIRDPRVFRKVVDANPALKHKLAGESRAKYRTAIIGLLLSASGVRSGEEKIGRSKVEGRGPKT